MEKKEKKRKYFIITKNKDEYITLELKELFDDPNKYLQHNTKFIIGNHSLNKHKIPKSLINKKHSHTHTKLSFLKNNEFDINNNNNTNEFNDKIEPKTSLNNIYKNKLSHKKKKKRCISAFNQKRNINYDIINTNKKSRNLLHSPYSVKSNISSSPLKSIHYEYKTPKEILDIFNKYNQKDKKDENINLFSKKINDINNQKYLIQEKSLKINSKEKNNLNNFSKYLAQKCEKKEENLLLNKIENFNIKKQVINYLYKQKLLSEKLGNNYWICNLRRPKNKYKINYVNTGRSDKEPWEQIVEPGDSEIEYINNPCSPITIDNNGGGNFFKYIKKYPNLKSFNKIKIEGKNLFNQEYTNFISNFDKSNKTIKFKLYKDPQENKSKSIQELTYKENYRPFLRKKKMDFKKKLI